jgi:hypothetical protein
MGMVDPDLGLLQGLDLDPQHCFADTTASAVDPDPNWIRIREGKNDPQT